MMNQAYATQLVFKHMETALLFFDADQKLDYINPAAEMLIGRSANRVLGYSIETICSPYPQLQESLRYVIEQLQPINQREIVLTVAKNQDITINLTAQPIIDYNEFIGILVEVQRVDRHLSISDDDWQRRQYSATRALLRGLAHEIKNPLGGLRGAAQLLKEELGGSNLAEYAGVIMNEADRLRTLIDQMLGPRQQPLKVNLNVHEVIEYVRRLIEVEQGIDQISVKGDYDPSIPDVIADRGMMVQSLLNIAVNAIDAMREKGGLLTFRTRICRRLTINGVQHPLTASIEVIDNGPGIPAELAPQIFYPMVSGKAEGTGLGLSIAQSLIDLNGGMIKVDSDPKETIFQILLPVEY